MHYKMLRGLAVMNCICSVLVLILLSFPKENMQYHDEGKS
jgi:hypothetical protein